MKKILLLILLAAVSFSCMHGFNLPDQFSNRSPRAVYEKKLKRDFPTLAGWQVAHDNALLQPRNINLPHGGKGNFGLDAFPVYSYRFNLEAGEVIDAEVHTDSIGQNTFIDLYAAADIAEPIESNTRESKSLEFAVRETGTYILTVQPEVGADNRCTVLINKRPLYAFPVAGKGNAAIQSFWAAPRDGGKRSHEGIDIFAKKGTPVVAVTDGMITDSGERGLGGKQVWLRTGMFGNNIYYAHLDRIAVSAGTLVKTGDTLGYVGNTGNAKGGPPHLHFGIYAGWQGAVNPLPFVYKHKQLTASQFEYDRGKRKFKNEVGLKG